MRLARMIHDICGEIKCRCSIRTVAPALWPQDCSTYSAGFSTFHLLHCWMVSRGIPTLSPSILQSAPTKHSKREITPLGKNDHTIESISIEPLWKYNISTWKKWIVVITILIWYVLPFPLYMLRFWMTYFLRSGCMFFMCVSPGNFFSG